MIYHQRYRLNKNLGKLIEKIFCLFDILVFISERTDSNETTDMKKEIKPKRLSSGNSTRPSDSSNATNRSLTVNFKEIPQKTRRAMTENGVSKVCFIQIMIFINKEFISSLAFEKSN